MIRLRDVTVTYPTGAIGLDGVSLEIPDGQFVVVVGLSGAGKSTLIRTIDGIVRVTSGSVEVDGFRVDGATNRRLRTLRSRVGMMFQSFNLVPRATVLSNVLMGRLRTTPWWRALLGWWRRVDVELAFEALERVGIVEKAYHRASALSGGQQQRVAIARALAQQPTLILADEPVASLDPPTADRVMRDLRRVNRELAITVVVNLHAVDLAVAHADRIVGMRAGRVVFDGPVDAADDAAFERIYGRPLRGGDVATGRGAAPIDPEADA